MFNSNYFTDIFACTRIFFHPFEDFHVIYVKRNSALLTQKAASTVTQLRNKEITLNFERLNIYIGQNFEHIVITNKFASDSAMQLLLNWDSFLDENLEFN